jgi:hypothetical protein
MGEIAHEQTGAELVLASSESLRVRNHQNCSESDHDAATCTVTTAVEQSWTC